MSSSLFPHISDTPPLSAAERERASQRERMSAKRAAGREVELWPVLDPARRERCRHNLELFAMTYFPWLFFLTLSKMHRDIFEEMQESILHGGKIALAAPRGSGKTTIVLVAIAWAIVYGHAKYIVLVCAEGGQARKRLKTIKRFFSRRGSIFAEDFPEVCAPVQELQGSPQRASKLQVDGQLLELSWGTEEIQFGRTPVDTNDGKKECAASGTIVVAKGLDSAIRGLVDGEKRPDLVLVDDPQTRESAHSDLQTKARDETFKQDIEGLVGPGQSLTIISLWTVIVKGDLADRYTSDMEPGYLSMRYKALTKMPAEKDLIEEYVRRVHDAKRNKDHKARAAHAWYLRNREKYESAFEASWEQNFKNAVVSERARANVTVDDNVKWAEDNCPELLWQEEVSAVQHQLNKICEVGYDAWSSEYQNDPRNPFDDIVKQLELSVFTGRLTRVPRAIVPAECNRLGAMIDVGSDSGIHWVVNGTGTGFSGGPIDYGKIEVDYENADDEEPAIWAALEEAVDKVCGRKFVSAGGTEMMVNLCLIDAGYKTTLIYQFCRENKFAAVLIPSMGVGLKPGQQLYRTVPKQAQAGDGWIIAPPKDHPEVYLCRMDANYWKTFHAERWLAPMGAAGRFALFGADLSIHRTFIDHQCSEYRTRIQVQQGVTSDVHSLRPGVRDNHWLDCMVGCCVVGSILGERLIRPNTQPKKPRRKKRRVKTARSLEI